MNSEITAETRRAIKSENSSQMSRKLEEVKMDLNSHVFEGSNSAIEEKVLPIIQNTLNWYNSTSSGDLDLRSDGPHQSIVGQMAQKGDLRSDRPH